MVCCWRSYAGFLPAVGQVSVYDDQDHEHQYFIVGIIPYILSSSATTSTTCCFSLKSVLTSRIPHAIASPGEDLHLLQRQVPCIMTTMWGFPKITGAILGVPIIRAIVYWGLYWGPLILGNYYVILYLPLVN